jgi:hypothetical protein
MTQRKWTTTDGWSVLTGWDRPLQHFFVSIDRECGGCDGEGIITDGFGGAEDDPRDCTTCEGTGNEYLYNNLEDTKHTDAMGGMTIEQVKTVLELKLTKYPEGLLEALILDQAGNIGNLVQEYEPYGEEKEQLS